MFRRRAYGIYRSDSRKTARNDRGLVEVHPLVSRTLTHRVDGPGKDLIWGVRPLCAMALTEVERRGIADDKVHGSEA